MRCRIRRSPSSVASARRQGASGRGEPTLVAVLGLLDEPTGGASRVAQTDARGSNPRRRAHLRNCEPGLVAAAFRPAADLAIRENVEMALRDRKPARSCA